VDAPLDRVPMLLEAGGILPLQDVVQYVGEATAAADVGGGDAAPAPSRLTLEVFPAASGAFELYEDDGSSFDYRDGTYRTTRFSVAPGEGGLELVREVTHDVWSAGERLLEIRFHAVETAPEAVSVDGRALSPLDPTANGDHGYTYDAERGMLTVRVHEMGKRQTIAIR
jgi:alpha-glucosidase